MTGTALPGEGGRLRPDMTVRMPAGPLKQVGDYPLVVALHTDVTAGITVSVLGDTSSGG